MAGEADAASIGTGGFVADAGPDEAGGAPSASPTTSWRFPALIPNSATDLALPSYLAHLLGQKIQSPFSTDLVCADIANNGPTTQGTMTVKVAVYAQDAMQTVSIPNGKTTACLTPAFDFGKLYALQDATPGRIETQLQVGGTVISSAMRAVSISPPSDAAWVVPGVPLTAMEDLSAVFVTPKDPKIDQLQRLAASFSVFNGFGGGEPYKRDPYSRTTAVDAGQGGGEFLFLEKGETMGWTIGSVTGGTDTTMDVFLFTSDQYTAWMNGTSTDATLVWNAQIPGAIQNGISVPEGWYALIFFNPGTVFNRSVQWARSVTREDVAQDVLGSIYAALQSIKTTYSSITDSYFTGFQHIRRASEVLSALSANCIDGSLLFASTMELLGLEPVVFIKTGHAYVGVRSAPGSAYAWPVETTMVGTSPFADAFTTGLSELSKDPSADPRFHPVLIKELRGKGILPQPQ